jgi:hypothetical protein
VSNRTDTLIDAYLQGAESRSEIIPGSAEQLKKAALHYRPHDSAEDRLAFLHDYLEHGGGRRYLSREHRPEQPEAPARVILRRLEAGKLLGRGKADQAYDAWAARLAMFDDSPTALAGAIGRRVMDQSNREFLRNGRMPGDGEAPGPDQAALKDHFREIGAGLM